MLVGHHGCAALVESLPLLPQLLQRHQPRCHACNCDSGRLYPSVSEFLIGAGPSRACDSVAGAFGHRVSSASNRVHRPWHAGTRAHGRLAADVAAVSLYAASSTVPEHLFCAALSYAFSVELFPRCVMYWRPSSHCIRALLCVGTRRYG